MSAFADIVISDGATNRTFVPIMFDKNGVAWWEEQGVAASAIGNNRISAQLVRASNPAPGESSKSRVNRVIWTMHFPGLETLGNSDSGLVPAPTVAYIDRIKIEGILSERGTSTNRAKEQNMLFALTSSLGAFTNMFQSFAGIY